MKLHLFKKIRKIRKEVQTSPNLLVEFYIKVYEKSVKCFWLFAHTYKLHYTYKERIKVRLFKKFTENKELVTNWIANLVAALQFLRFWEYFSLSVLELVCSKECPSRWLTHRDFSFSNEYCLCFMVIHISFSSEKQRKMYINDPALLQKDLLLEIQGI